MPAQTYCLVKEYNQMCFGEKSVGKFCLSEDKGESPRINLNPEQTDSPYCENFLK